MRLSTHRTHRTHDSLWLTSITREHSVSDCETLDHYVEGANKSLSECRLHSVIKVANGLVMTV